MKTMSNKLVGTTVRSQSALKFLRFMSEHYLLVILIMLILVGFISSPNFLTVRNITNVLLQNSMNTIIAMGMLFVIITRGIDLSVGSILALAGCLVAGQLQQGTNTIMAVIIVLSMMAVLGAASGFMVSVGKVAPFIVTLAMMTIVSGMAFMYQIGADRRIDGTPLTNFINSNLFMIPAPVYIMVFVIVIAWITLEKTTFGRSVYAIGGNSEAARLAGVRVTLTLIIVYAISAVFAGSAGIILTGRLSLGTAIVGQGAELDAIAAVVIGGASMNGGKGTVINTVIGAFVIGLIVNIMNINQIPAYPQLITRGVIILIAVIWQRKS